MTQKENTFLAITYKVEGRYTELRYEKDLENAVSYLDGLSYDHGVKYEMDYKEETETYYLNWYTKDGKYIRTGGMNFLPVWISEYEFGK